MQPARQCHYVLSAQVAGDKRPGMTDDSRLWKSWYVGKWNAHRVFDFVGKSAKSRAEYDRDVGKSIADSGANRIGRGFRRVS